MMSSFGFGQVGGTCLVLHPRHLLGVIEPSEYEAYKVKNAVRAKMCYRVMSEMMVHNNLVKIKEAPPFSKDLEASVQLNSLARASRDVKSGAYSFKAQQPEKPTLDIGNVDAISKILLTSSTAGIGVDQDLISAVPSSNPTFVSRNFTSEEITYCNSQPSPSASFAARWVGKEAVFKSLGVPSKGSAAPMKDIEILPDEVGVPRVFLHGDAKLIAEEHKITSVHISLSHSDTVAIAFAQAVTE